MVEDVAGIAIEALEGLGAVSDVSPSRRRRSGCGWFALILLVVMLIAVGAALLQG